MKKTVRQRITFAVKITVGISAALAVMIGTVILLYINGLITLKHPEKKYPVKGVDVSSYQGDIDWQVLSKDIDFAYIKATEGSSSFDSRFEYNWQQAQKTGIRTGAYHFFSFDSSGKTQAENFISTVEAVPDMLPPVIDIEFYADKQNHPPNREDVNAQLDILISQLEKHYGTRPVIYSTGAAYQIYLSGGYMDYDIWIRDIFREPSLPDGRKWTFWQYSEKGQLEGYSGDEHFIDLNVFCGSEEDFRRYGK